MNNTLSNGFKLLEYLAASGSSHAVTELAEIFNLPASHICRLLKTLLETGYIQQENDRRYKISVKVLALSHSCLTSLEVRNAARPYLFQLQQKLRQDIYLSIPLDGRALTVDVISSAPVTRKSPSIGRINPVNYSSSGKLCAAFAPAQIQRKLLKEPLEQASSRTITVPELLRQEFDKIIRQRFAESDGENSSNVYSVAAPVFAGNGTLVAAVGSYRKNDPAFTAEMKQEMRNDIICCANAIACELLAGKRTC